MHVPPLLSGVGLVGRHVSLCVCLSMCVCVHWVFAAISRNAVRNTVLRCAVELHTITLDVGWSIELSVQSNRADKYFAVR